MTFARQLLRLTVGMVGCYVFVTAALRDDYALFLLGLCCAVWMAVTLAIGSDLDDERTMR